MPEILTGLPYRAKSLRHLANIRWGKLSQERIFADRKTSLTAENISHSEADVAYKRSLHAGPTRRRVNFSPTRSRQSSLPARCDNLFFAPDTSSYICDSTMSFGYSIGDFIALFNLLNTVRKQFVDAPGQFRAISHE